MLVTTFISRNTDSLRSLRTVSFVFNTVTLSLQLTLLAHEIGHMFGIAVSTAQRKVRRGFPETSTLRPSLFSKSEAAKLERIR